MEKWNSGPFASAYCSFN